MPAAEVIAQIEELQEQLAQSKRLLLTLCATPELDTPELRDLASYACMAEQMVTDLSRSIAVRNPSCGGPLKPHELQVLQTAMLVDRSIDLALERTIDATASSFAIH
jgi:hypothetical protein